jgi:iron(III) transport system permease protein
MAGWCSYASPGIALLLCLGPLILLLCSPSSSQSSHPPDLQQYLELLLNSFMLAGGTTLIALLCAWPIALALFKWPIRLRPLWLALTAASVTIPLYIYTAAWLGYFEYSPSLTTSGSQSLARMLQACLISGMAKTPLCVLLSGLILWGLRPQDEEFAWLHTPPRGVLRHVTLPHLLKGSLISGSIIFAFTLTEITVSDMLTIRTLAEEIYIQFQLSLDPVAAGRLSLPLFIPLLVILFLMVRMGIHQRQQSIAFHYRRATLVFSNLSRTVRYSAPLFALLIVVICIGCPLGIIMRQAGPIAQWPTQTSKLFDSWTLSTWTTLSAALLASLAAFCTLWPVRHRTAGQCTTAIALFALFVPGSLIGIALIHLFNRPGLIGSIYQSPMILVIAQFQRLLPLCLLVQYIYLSSIPREYDELATMDGMPPSKATFRLGLPMSIKPLLTVSLLAFCWGLGELDASIIVCPPGTTPLPVRIFTMMHYGVYEQVAAACLLLTSTVLLLALLLIAAGMHHQPSD